MLKSKYYDCDRRIFLQAVDAFVLFAKLTKLVTEFGSSFSLVDFDFPSESFKLVDIFGATLFLDRQQFNIKGFLVGFLQERDQKLAGSKHLWLQNAVQETLVVSHSLSGLIWC